MFPDNYREIQYNSTHKTTVVIEKVEKSDL